MLKMTQLLNFIPSLIKNNFYLFLMENSKKGIRLKTKEISLVDNIVNFFKKESKNEQDDFSSPLKDLNDGGPRSTTPRKKIFNKTPEKASMIKFNKNINKGPNMNNKSINAEHDQTYCNEKEPFQKFHTKSQLSPSNKVNYVLKPMEDTQFNKLILGASNAGINQKRSRTPQRTFLSDNNQNSKPQNNLNQRFDRKGLISNSNESSLKKIHQQLQNYKRLSEQLRAQNIKLKRENQGLVEQVQNLKKMIKSYELSNKNSSAVVEIINLDTPKSPFQKKSSFNQEKRSPLMKQSLPIMPQTPNQYVNKSTSPKIEEFNFMSSNLRSISNQTSFASDHSNDSLPSFKRKLNNCQQNENNNQIESQLFSPFMDKSTFDKTMKPQQKNKKSFRQQELKEQNSFQKTVGYLKGDQPNYSADQKSKKPFQEISTQSNKFFFQQKNNFQSNNSSNIMSSNKGLPTRQWLTFNENEVRSRTEQYNNLTALKNENPFSKVVNPLGKRNQKQKYEEKSQNFLKQSSVSKSRKIDQSKTYKFEDFDINDRESSYADFF